MLSRADSSSSDSCWVEVTEYPRLPAAHPREGWKAREYWEKCTLLQLGEGGIRESPTASCWARGAAQRKTSCSGTRLGLVDTAGSCSTSPAAPLPIELPADAPEKAVEDGSMGLLHPEGIPGSTCLLPGPALAVVTIWGVKQWMEDCLSLGLSNKQIFKKTQTKKTGLLAASRPH